MAWAVAWACVAAAQPAAADEDAQAVPAQRLDAALAAVQGPAGNRAGIEQVTLRLQDAMWYYATSARVDPTGQDLEDVEVALRRAGTTWAAAALTSPRGGLQQRLAVDGLDAAGLAWDGGRVHGDLTATVARFNAHRDTAEGENMHSMLKARRRTVINWHIGGRARTQPGAVTINIDARAVPQRQVFLLHLSGFAGGHRAARPPAAGDTTPLSHREAGALLPEQRNPLLIEMVRQGEKFVAGEGQTPSWNRALHAIDADDLRVQGDRLVGTLRVTLMPDPWVPGGGSNGKRQREISCEVDAVIDAGLIAGTYQATGDQGEYAGTIRGQLWQALAGTYTIRDIDGQRSGAISGRTRLVPAASATSDAQAGPSLPDELPDHLARAAARYRQVSAALRELHGGARPPLPAFALGDAEPDALLADMARFAERAITAQPPAGHVQPEDQTFGPFGATEALPGSAVPDTFNTPGPQAWAVPQAWRVVGPIERQGTLDVPGGLPAALPTPGVVYRVQRPKLDGQVTLQRGWHDAKPDAGVVRPNPDDFRDTFTRMSEYGAYSSYPANESYYAKQIGRRSHVWYATTRLDAPRDGRLWVAVETSDFGRLWVNGQPVWTSGLGDDDAQRSVSVLSIPVRKGSNEILIESGKRRINYYPHHPWDRSMIRFWVSTRGQPRSAAELAAWRAAVVERYEQAGPFASGMYVGGQRQYADATPPMQWDLERGQNIAWRAAVGHGRSMPVLAGQRIFVTAEPNVLVCLDRDTGKELWRRTCEPGDGAPQQDAKQRAKPQAGPTPVVHDGKVYAVFGTSAAACFDLDGAALWSGTTGIADGGSPEHAPILADGKLICSGRGPRDPDTKQTPLMLVALDAQTGAVVWRCEPLPGEPDGVAPMRLFAGDAQRVVLLTAQGSVIDAADGRVIERALFGLPGHTPPIVTHDTAVFVARNLGQASFRFWIDPQGRVLYRRLWDIRRAGSSSPQYTSHGLAFAGDLYIPRSADENAGHHPVPWDQLDVYDWHTGQHLARPNPAIINTATPLPLARAGQYIVLSDEGRRSWGGIVPHGTIAFLAAGDRSYLVARGELPDRKLDAPPVFFGNHMVVRSGGELICIGSDSADQHRSDLEAIARFAVAEIGPEPEVPTARIAPLAGFQPGPDAPVSELLPGVPPDTWLMAGPMPSLEAPGLPGIDNPATFTPEPGAPVKLDGGAFAFGPLPSGAVFRGGATTVFRSDGTFYRPTAGVDIGVAIDRTEFSTTYFATVLHVRRPTSMRLRFSGARGFLSGVELEPDQALELTPGYYPLVMRVDVGRLPPVGRVTLAPDPVVTVSDAEARRAWLDRIRIRRGLLERAAEAFPDRGVGLRARRLLDALADADNP